MSDYAWLGFLGLVLAFQFVVIFVGPPYLRTLRKQRQTALDLMDLKPGQHLIDLGCGDGVMLKTAARRGINATGYEINPLLVIVAWLNTRRCQGKVRVVWGNFWRRDLGPTDGIFVFLNKPYMAKFGAFLDTQKRLGKPKLVSFGFALPGKKPAAKRGAVFLYNL